jgi:hypothetical protein
MNTIGIDLRRRGRPRENDVRGRAHKPLYLKARGFGIITTCHAIVDPKIPAFRPIRVAQVLPRSMASATSAEGLQLAGAQNADQ